VFHLQNLIRVIIIATWMIFVTKVIPLVLSHPHPHSSPLHHPQAEERMIMPPTFGFSSLPPGYTASGLFCFLFTGPYRQAYAGGWFNRACQGPIPPFIRPNITTIATTTTPATTSKPKPTAGTVVTTTTVIPVPAVPANGNAANNPYGDGGDPIEGSPWDPDDEDLFIENYGKSASNPNFRLGDPSRRSQHQYSPYRGIFPLF